MTQRAWTLAGLAGLLLVASCDGLTSSERDAAAGTYVLATVDGDSVPYVEWSGISGYSTITSGEITLRTDRTFRDVIQRTHYMRVPEAVIQEHDTVQGRYTRQGSTVVLTAEDGTADTLALGATTVTRMAPTISSGPQNPVPWIYIR